MDNPIPVDQQTPVPVPQPVEAPQVVQPQQQVPVEQPIPQEPMQPTEEDLLKRYKDTATFRLDLLKLFDQLNLSLTINNQLLDRQNQLIDNNVQQ